MRMLIAAMKMSLDGKIEGPEGYADWVDAWSEDYGLTRQIDACLLGGRMYPGYEQYWSAMQAAPNQPLPMTGRMPTPAELEWARFAARTPHYVLSASQTTARWSTTTFLRRAEDVAALKTAPGKDIYLMGGAQIVASFIEAGLVDELRLIVHPLIAGDGKSPFAGVRRHALELTAARPLEAGCIGLSYKVC